MEQNDINQFEEMIAECFSISVGTKRTIRITKEAFKSVGIELDSNNIFYEIKSTKKTEGKLILIEDKNLKIEILKQLHIL